jgi:hypothetical protein
MALGVLLVLNVALVFLLTPLGFENRPPSALKVVGYLAIATIFVGLFLDLAALVLLLRRARLAAGLAMVAAVLFFFPNLGDHFGAFFSLPIPTVINTLEYIFMPVLLVTLFVAWRVYRESSRGAAPS